VKILTLLQLSYMNIHDKMHASFRYCFKQLSLPAAKKYASDVCECSPTYAMLMLLFANVIICVAFLLWQSRIFTTDILIIGRQLVELCFSGGLSLHDICLQF